MRNLASAEIEQLKNNGNRCADWSLISVVDDFECDKVVGNRFSGRVTLGNSEVSDSMLCDCTIGDGCSVSYVRLLKGYTVEDGCELRNIGELSALAEPYMPMLSPMNENGGREIGVFRGMTVGDAYLWAKYRGVGLQIRHNGFSLIVYKVACSNRHLPLQNYTIKSD